MHNFFTVEVEAELRRHELEREAAADARAAQAGQASKNRRWLSTVTRTFSHLPALALPNVPVGAPLELRRVPRPVEC